ncbi:hypothetical protein FNF27_02458 [Cafeteria roenbergensis]|uniref:Uncharacterized protein n=1 Tax=Cafeteria roenbergensis TaxID=33653 RepID=A0A5A8EE23_CAFRO|nr:hypothetical protein FNF27_02458 [Cafeteria roenbergensis]
MFGTPAAAPAAAEPQENVKELGSNIKFPDHQRALKRLLEGPKDELQVPNWGVSRRLWDAALCGEWTDCILENDAGTQLQCHTAVICSLSPVLLAHVDEGDAIPEDCAPWLEVERSGGRTRIQMSGVSSGVLTAVMRAAYGMPTRHARKDLRQLQHVAHALGADALEHEAATSLLSGTEAMSTVQAFAHAAAEGDLEGARAHLLAMCKDGTATLASWDVLDLEPELFAALISRDELTLEPLANLSPEMQVFEAALRWARNRIGLAPVDERRVVRRMRGRLPNAVASRLLAASSRAVKQASPELESGAAGGTAPASLAAAAAAAADREPEPDAATADDSSSHETVADVLAPVSQGHLVKPPEEHSLAIGRKLARPAPKVEMLAKTLTSSLGLMPPPPKGRSDGNSSAPPPADYGKLLRAQLLPAILPALRLQALSSAELAVEVLPLGVLSRAEVRSLLANAVAMDAGQTPAEVVPVLFSSAPRSGLQLPLLGKSCLSSAVAVVQASLRLIGAPSAVSFEHVIVAVLSQLDRATKVSLASTMWTPYEWTKGLLPGISLPSELRFVATNLVGMALFLPSTKERAAALNGMAELLGPDFAGLLAACKISEGHCKPPLRLAADLGLADELARAAAIADSV